MPEVVARSSSWKTEALPDARAALPYQRALSPEEYARVQAGLIPQTTDDRWFAYVAQSWLYLHRSWTGFCIFRLRWEKMGRWWRVGEAWVNRDPAQYTSDDAVGDMCLLDDLIDRLLREGEAPT